MRSDRKIRERMEKRRKSNTVEGKDLRSQLSYTQGRNRHPAP